jgi:DGQHR domain-containing protein
MDISMAKAKVDQLESNEKMVGRLLLDLGFELVSCGDDAKVFKDKQKIGQIDLLFKDKNLKRIFLIEVSRQIHERADKIGNFFHKWGDSQNIDLVRTKFSIVSTYRITRIYFDFTGEDDKPSSVNIGKDEHYLGKEDFDYFNDAYEKVNQLARNDFLSFLNIKPSELDFVEKDAIQFYLGEVRAYVYVDIVENLLKYCYVFRRKRNDNGYQRMLEKGKIGNIARKIKSGNILAFPNSILLSSPGNSPICAEIKDKSECPAPVKIKVPREYCACRIIDGQHRLLGFARLEKNYQENHFIPVVMLERIERHPEMKTFIEINSGQKKIDRNLILVLESDFDWDQKDNPKEFVEKQAVEVVKKLNLNSPLAGKIFIPHALEKKKNKLMLNTFVSAIINNNFIGGRLHLYQNNNTDIDGPYKSIRLIFSQLKQYMPKYSINVGDFFLSNKGLRVIFRLMQIFTRNKNAGKISVEQEQFMQDFKTIMNDKLRKKIEQFYGEGGAAHATEIICKMLKKKKAYSQFILDLRSL